MLRKLPEAYASTVKILALPAPFFLFLELGLASLSIWKRGMREPDSVVRGDGTLKILYLGESTTASGGLGSYPSLQEAALQACFPGHPIQVINAGIPGTNSKEILDKLPEHLELYRPSIALAMTGINDHWSLAGDNQRSLRLSDWRSVRLFQLAYVDFQKWLGQRGHPRPQ